ncbi:MAG: glycosyltransferase family 2 protein, partial [Pyrobaculum sp.]
YTLGFFLSIVLPAVGLAIGAHELLTGLALHPINLIKDVVRGRGVAKYTGLSIRLRDVVSTWAVGNFVIPLAVWASVFKKCIYWRGRKICR